MKPPKFKKGDICVWSARALNIGFEGNSPQAKLLILREDPPLAGTQMYHVRYLNTGQIGEASSRTEWALIKIGEKGGDVE